MANGRLSSQIAVLEVVDCDGQRAEQIDARIADHRKTWNGNIGEWRKLK